MRKKTTSIGGQAVIEGVMMRGTKSVATAVRNEKGDIVVESSYVKPVKEKNILFRIPVIRGFLNFISSMVIGMKNLMRSGEVFGEDAEPGKFEKWLSKKFGVDVYSIVMAISVVLGIALSVFLFVFLPNAIEGLIIKLANIDISIPWVNLLIGLMEGAIRMGIFIAYIGLTTLMPDVKRTYMYHGAEHKTISCYEHDMELTVENAQKMTTFHDRCGTTFMFIVMAVSILILAIVNALLALTGLDIFQNNGIRFLIKLALIPFIAGVSYEVLKFLAKFDNWFVRLLKMPGFLLQKLTTKEPTDDMVEVAIVAFKTAQQMDNDPTTKEQKFDIKVSLSKVRGDIEEKLKKTNADSSEVEWILSIAMGIKRSELPLQKFILQSQLDEANKILEKRLTGMPLWKVIGNTDFCGYTINVNEDVLSPRVETENLVEEALKVVKKDSKVLDLCTGSGCVAIAVSKETGAHVVASDISAKALIVAKQNVELNKADVELVESDLYENIKGTFDVITANPPYIPSDIIPTLDKEVKDFDPMVALDGGKDGLTLYRRIVEKASDYLNVGGYMLFECGENEAKDIANMFTDSYKVDIRKDLEGIDRILVAKREK